MTPLHARPRRSAWDWTAKPAGELDELEPATDRIIRGYARCRPSRVLATVLAWSLLVHEALYHAAGGDEFPFTVLAEDVRVLVLSHGGADVLVSALVAVAAMLLWEAARIREGIDG